MEKFLQFVFAIFAFVYVVNGQAIFKDCGSQVGKLGNVTITGCTSPPCIVKKGSTYTVKVTFVSMEATDQAWAVVHGIVEGVPVPYKIANPNGCVKSGITCPMKSGTTYSYTSSLQIMSFLPDIKVLVKWELADAKTGGQDLFCFETLIQVEG